ncbi:MAG TPA: hypothetical protein VIU37_09555 [Candidatus Limnocylindrales bacterium]
MTHRYTILTGGLVLPSVQDAAVTAIAWAGDTVIALGSDEAMRGLSRGDSWFVDLEGATVVPLADGDPAWPVATTLEIGGRADLAILATDPRLPHPADLGPSFIAVVRAGRVVAGRLPGAAHEAHAEHLPGS